MKDLKKITIVPSFARKDTMEELVKDNNILFGKQVLSLNAYKNTLIYDQIDKKEEYTKLFIDIQNNINKKNRYYNQLVFPSFFNYFYNFSSLLIKYNISIDDIKDDDKKEILEYLIKNNTIDNNIRKAFNEIEDASDIEIYDYLYIDLKDQKDIDYLINKGASLVNKQEYKDTKYECYFANNEVKEVLALAQYFIKEIKENKKFNHEDYVVMYTDKDTYIPLIKRIFKYYNIPFNLTYTIANNQASRFLSFLRFIRKQDINSFIDAYNNKAFKNSSYKLVRYLKENKTTYEQLLKPFDYAKRLNERIDENTRIDYVDKVFGGNFSSALSNEENAEEKMKDIRPLLLDKKFISLKDKSLKEQSTYAYNHLFDDISSLTTETLNEIQNIHDLCKQMVSQSGDDDKIFDLLEYELNKLSSTKNIEYENGIRIVDAYQNIKSKNAIILGCNQENYPKIIAQRDFFDEEYIEENIKTFPSLLDRTNHFEQAYDKLLHSFDHVIFSYPLGAVEGTKYQRSTFISNYVPKEKINDKEELIENRWPLSENDNVYEFNPTLSEENAKKIYLKDGAIKASPTSFEKYVKCPFSYFIEKGLKVKANKEFEVSPASIGNVRHHLFERMFNNEIELNEDNLEEHLDTYFDFIKEVYINDVEEMDAIKERLYNSSIEIVKFLNNFKKVNKYHSDNEFKINEIFEFDKYKFELNASIDRLDTLKDNYRIFDYKSSKKEIKSVNLEKGLNFQLLAYLVFYYLSQKNNNLNPEFVAYMNSKYSKIDISKVDSSKDEATIRKEDIAYDVYALNNEDLDVRFFNKQEFDLNFDQVKDYIEKLYVTIAEKILSGNIEVNPKGEYSPCTFCDYQDLCHNKNQSLKESEMKVLYSFNNAGGEEDVK